MSEYGVAEKISSVTSHPGYIRSEEIGLSDKSIPPGYMTTTCHWFETEEDARHWAGTRYRIVKLENLDAVE